MKDTIRVKVGGKDENKIFDAVTAHYKALAHGATPETAPPLPDVIYPKAEGNIIILRSGGPDEWAASNAIVAEARARWEAEAAAKNGEFRAARNRKPNRLASRAPKSPIRPRTLCRY